MPHRTRQQHKDHLSYEQAWKTYKAYVRGRASDAALGAAVKALEYHARKCVVARLLLATVMSDDETPFFNTRRAAAQYARCVREGLPEAASMLASDYSGNGALQRNLSRRFFWLMEGWKLGNAECTFYAGLALVAGRGVRRDETQGVTLIREAVAYPDARAVIALLDLLSGASHEPRRAIEQMEAAAHASSTEAWLMLGVLVQCKLPTRATTSPIECYRRAARADNGAAMWNLRTCYAAGLGVSRSPAKARYWCQRSGENGVMPLESNQDRVGAWAWGRKRLYPLPMMGPFALSSYEELSAVVGDGSFAGAKPPASRAVRHDQRKRPKQKRRTQ